LDLSLSDAPVGQDQTTLTNSSLVAHIIQALLAGEYATGSTTPNDNQDTPDAKKSITPSAGAGSSASLSSLLDPLSSLTGIGGSSSPTTASSYASTAPAAAATGLGAWYSGIGGTKTDSSGNAPLTDMFGINLNGNEKVHHDNTDLQAPGAAIGGLIGNLFPEFGGTIWGPMAGRNAGQTVGDLAGGNIEGLGADISQNLPPGFQDKGWGGILNGATGLPLSKLFSIF